MSILPRALALAAIVAAGHASAAITLFSHEDFHGKRVTLVQPTPDFRDFNFNDRASSVVVEDEPWEVCTDIGFRNRCAILVPGNYPNLAAVGLGDQLSSARPAHREPPPPPPVVVAPPPPTGDIVFYEHPGFHGRGLGTSSEIDNLTRYGFNDRASSVIVFEGRWEVCEDRDFSGRCMILRPGRYPDLRDMGLNSKGDSVGYWDADGVVTHGYVRRADGRIATLDVPDAARTAAFAINDRGQVAGYFMDASGGLHGFVKTGQQFQHLDVPGAVATIVTAINNWGSVAGEYFDASGVRHGFLAILK